MTNGRKSSKLHMVHRYDVTSIIKLFAKPPDHVQAESSVRNDGQVLPHAQLLGREDALHGTKKEAVVFNLINTNN